MSRHRLKSGRLRLYPWNIRLLRLLIDHGPLTTREVGDRLYRDAGASRAQAARYELVELFKMGLIQRDRGGLRTNDPLERWHPELFTRAIVEQRDPRMACQVRFA